MRYAVVDATNTVVEVVDLDGSNVAPPSSSQALVCDPPAGTAAGWTFSAGLFAAPLTLAQVQAVQIAALTQACSNQIVAGFTSSGLGSSYAYPSGLTDQANLSASVLASLMPNNASGWTTAFLCAPSAQAATPSAWAFVNHTAAQIQQVGEDGKSAILAMRVKLATLSVEVMAATTASAVNAITW